jgi:hypothetical protein
MVHQRAKNTDGRELDYCENCGWHWWEALFDGHKGWECVPHIVEDFQRRQANPQALSWASYALNNPEMPVHGE